MSSTPAHDDGPDPRIQAAYTSGQLGDDGKEDPRAKEIREDREKASKELEGRFKVLKPGETPTGAPNELSPEQYQQVVGQYSDIRMGESNIKLKTDGMDEKEKKKFMDGTMNDLASMFQTKAGRDLLGQLGSATDENGLPRLTHIKNETNPEAASAGASNPDNNEKRFDGTGTDMRVKYAPGQDVKMDGSASGWLPMRSDVTLFHEMTHALHGINGETARGNQDASAGAHPMDKHGGIQSDEYPTVGLGAHKDDPITENAYRAERRALAGTDGARAGDEAPGMQNRGSYTPELSPEKRAELLAMIQAQRAAAAGAAGGAAATAAPAPAPAPAPAATRP